MTEIYDVGVVGGGPAGLSACISGSSERLKMMLFDTGPELGGQAAKSSLIENYAGFPEGVSGEELIKRCVQQAEKFNTGFLCPHGIIGLRPEKDFTVLVSEYGNEYACKSVILSNGLSYRQLPARGLPALLGRGAYYGVPPKKLDEYDQKTVCIVGGANSAGQAAMQLSANKKTNVKLLIRKKLDDQMSAYLVDRVKNCGNIETICGVEVTGVSGKDWLEEIELEKLSDKSKSTQKADAMFIFIGAMPKTAWLQGRILLDPKNFVLTDNAVEKEKGWKLEGRDPFPLETCIPGVFAAGDVRLGSTKRIACAVGEGSFALQQVHAYLRTLNGNGSH